MLNQDFRDILSAFCDEKVDFIVVGAYAMSFHGFPRATGDIDLWIRCSDSNAERVWKALARFGAPLADLTREDLKTPGTVFQMGVAPRRIDILTEISGVEFDEAQAGCKEIEIAGLKIRIIGREDLLRNKKSAARPKDQADVAWLEGDGGDL
jgi:predicted nucleotidyltransferase